MSCTMSRDFTIRVTLSEDVYAKIQLLADEHAVGVDDIVIELIMEKISLLEVT